MVKLENVGPVRVQDGADLEIRQRFKAYPQPVNEDVSQ